MTKDTDRELLELAAKAAGLTIPTEKDTDAIGRNYCEGLGLWCEFKWGWGWWNPLTADGDALRLAVALGLEIYHADDEGMSVYVGYPNPDHEHYGIYYGICYAIEFYKDHDGDACAATRRAIVRAAAEIGKGVKQPISGYVLEDNYYKTQAEAFGKEMK